MNVTCERCNTEYDFDDTLVSGRGTTVKCTNCGHLFKVRKSGDPAAAPEKWVVRTVDGRELQFNALRELQAAITQRTIGREDVLSRGSSRPRRLGAISELEPFFTSTSAPAAPHVTTAPGLGATTPLVPTRARTTPGVMPAVTGPTGLPSAHAPDPDAVMDSSDMQEDATVVRPPPVNPEQVLAQAGIDPSAHRADKASARGPAKDGSPPPGKVPGAAKDGSPPPGKLPKEPAKPPEKPPARPTPPKGMAAQHPEQTPPAKPPEKPAAKPPAAEAEKPAAKPPEKPAAKPPEKPAAKPPEKPAAKPPSKESAAKASAKEAAADSDGKDANVSAAQRESVEAKAGAGARKLPVTAPASDVKISHIGEEEPRFSTPRPTTKPKGGGAQRIIAFVAVGVLAFVGVTMARRYLNKPTVEAPVVTPDQRVSGFLTEASKRLAEGDLLGAQSELDKASALAEKDPKIAVDLALLATVQADFKWLKLRLLPLGDPEQGAVKRELDLAIERAKKMVDNAQALAPNDPAVTRRRIDVQRISGSMAEARKLVPSLGGSSGQPDGAVVLAALDLAEEKPAWPSVIDRLRAGVVGEQSLGRARSMLVYALVRSGDIPAAKAEYDLLAAMPRPHPLLAALREFIARSEGPGADAGVDAGDLKPEEAIKLALELRGKGETKKAEEIFLDVLKKNPTSADAAVGLADIARARADMGTAVRYYEQALKHNSLHLPALAALADIKWDANDRQTALALYRKIVENGGGTSYVAHARSRLGGPIPEEQYVPPPPTYTPPPPVTTTPPPPPPPVTTEPPPPTPTPTVTTPPPPPTNTGPTIFEPEK
jgi:predicted Zn finger-like uncharacterized protein